MPYPRRSNRRSKLYEKQGENPLIFPVGGDDETAHILSGVTKKVLSLTVRKVLHWKYQIKPQFVLQCADTILCRPVRAVHQIVIAVAGSTRAQDELVTLGGLCRILAGELVVPVGMAATTSLLR